MDIKKDYIDKSLIINYSYFEHLKDRFLCMICSNLLIDPLMCSECEKTFCGKCITQWMSIKEECPTGCKKSSVKIKNVYKVIAEFLNELKLKCKYGCEIPLLAFISHCNQCEIDHLEDVNCWNCRNITKPSKMKEEREENIHKIMKDNKELKHKLAQNLEDQQFKESEIESQIELLRLYSVKERINGKVFKIEARLKRREKIKLMIEKLEQELNLEEDSQTLNKELNKLLKEQAEIVRLIDIYTYKENNDEVLEVPFKKSESQKFKKIYKDYKTELIQSFDKFKAKTNIIDESHILCITTFKLNKNFIIASGGNDKRIKLWDAEFGTLSNTLSGHTGSINCITHLNLSAKFNNLLVLASGGDDKTIKIWNPETGNLIRTLKCYNDNDRVNCLTAFKIQNVTVLACGSYDRTIKIWDPENGNLLKTLKGHSHYVYCLISINMNDLPYIVSGSAD